jgi:hypothetical protein
VKHLKTYKKFYESIGSPLLDLSNNVDQHLISQIQKSVKPPASILEISCGNGVDSLQLQELGFKVTCTELNPEYVQNAKDLGLNCIQHDTKNKFPFSDKEFDLIYSRLGLHYFTEEELNSIFSELQRIGKKVLITVKVVDDIKTGKVILTPDKWNEIISKFFDIRVFEIKEGELYGNQSKWIEIEGDSLEKTFEARVYQLSLVTGRSEIQEDMELMKDMLSDIEDFEDVGVHIKNWLDYIDIMINKDNWYKGNEENTFKLTENIHMTIQRFRKYFRQLGYSIQMKYLDDKFRTGVVSKEEYKGLWISDDEFLDDEHKGINNKEILRLQIRLT